MKISDLHQGRLFTADADETLEDAADRMRWHEIGALPVFAGHRLAGIITERDITAAVADGVDPATTLVAEYMTESPAVLGPDSELAEAAHTMLELGVRHLPIMRRGQLIGVLSMRDLFGPESG